jgi:acetyl esterase/lipase
VHHPQTQTHTDHILSSGHVLIQPSYRLLIPSSAHEILTDVRHFLTYLSSPAYQATLPEGVQLDLDNVVLSGFSGGAYVARLAVVELQERRKRGEEGIRLGGLVSYFGMGGDIFLPDWIEKNKKDRENDEWSPVESLYGSRELTDAPYTPGLKGWENKVDRDVVWDFYRSNGLFVDVLAGTKGEIRDTWYQSKSRVDGGSNSEQKEDVVREILDTKHHHVIPQLWFALPENVKDFPPSIFIHGTEDDMVPYEESINTFNQLKEAGNKDVQFVSIQGVNHDMKLPETGEFPKQTEEANMKVVEFLKKRLG